MKKWLIAISAVLILCIACIYIFIPSRLKIVRRVEVSCNASGAFKFVAEPGNWARWWPGKHKTADEFSYGGVSYRVTGILSNLVYINIHRKDSGVVSRLLMLPRTNTDSTDIQWDCELPVGMDPISRWSGYRRALALSEDMDGILSGLGRFLQEKSNVYGLDIRPGVPADSFLLGTRVVVAAAPRTAEIYLLIGGLQHYAGSEHARQTGHPMVNITRLGDGQFQVMAAIPTDRLLKGNAVFYSRNLVHGKYLVTDVNGGYAAVDSAIGQMQHYVQDHQRTVMAVPFQSLVTDRVKEPDSSRWVTRIYYPVY